MSFKKLLKEKLLPYQWDWIIQDHPNEIALKSRRTGFTWAHSLKMVLRASAGKDQNILSHTEDGAKLVIQDVRYWVEWLSEQGVISLADWDLQITIVRCKSSGAVIRSLPCVPRNIRGKKGDVFIDEAAWIPNLQEMMDACLPLKMWGGRISLVSTSNPLNTHWNKLLATPIWKVSTITLPDAVDQGLYRRICQVAGVPEPTRSEELQWVQDMIEQAGEAAGYELLCQTEVTTQGNWVSDRTRFVKVPVVEIDSQTFLHNMQIPQPHIIGADIGTESAPTSITVIGLDGALLAVYSLRKMRLPEIETVLLGLINSATDRVLIDTNGIGRGVGEHLRDRSDCTIQFCPNESKWINTHLVGCLGKIWSGEIEVSDDPLVLADLNSISITAGKVRIAQRSVNGLQYHGDTIISLAIAHTGLAGTEKKSTSFWDL